jgi:hypothetical protein
MVTMPSKADRMPICRSCGYRRDDLKMLEYRRADGVLGCSYPDCVDCRHNNARRLEALGFTILAGGDEVKSDG